MPGPTPDITRRTFRIELARSIPVGILEALMATFAILFVLRIYRPEGDMEKVWLLGSSQLGLVASLFIVPLTFRLRMSIPRKMAFSGAIATAFFFVSAVAHESLLVFTVCHCIAYFIMMMQTPLQTQLYQDNYPTENRGFLFGITSIVRGSSTVIFGLLAGMLLAQDLGYYRVLLWVFVAAAAAATFALFVTPGKPAEDDGDRIPLLHSLRWVKEDPAFRRLLVSWMFMGLGNLVALRLWVEYLGNERFGLNFSEARIAYLTLAIPFGCKLLTTFFWGRLFDRINFYLLRTILNMVFLAAILCVYVGGSYPWIFAGVILQGVAFGGGNIVWSLWVTKLAKPEHTSEYMSVHTFFTGIRGFAAPFIGFWILRDFGSTALGVFSAVMITIATLIVLPDVRLGKARRPATMLEPRGPGI